MSTVAWIDNFRENLKAALQRKGWTQQDLVRTSGVHYVTISRILSGSMSPSVEMCEKLAEAVGIDNPKIFAGKA